MHFFKIQVIFIRSDAALEQTYLLGHTDWISLDASVWFTSETIIEPID